MSDDEPRFNLLPAREEVVPEKRKHLSKKMKLEILIKTPKCSHCGERLNNLQDIEWDHIIPLALGGSQELHNWEPVHVNCHKQKTKTDVSRIRKSKRIAAKRTGTCKQKKKIPSRPFQKKAKEC
jgi:5-methylcytosine-specific restriction endonuclease McrA